mmetsp:Transcript_109989/g.200188  ORF Transcript_109989/g.200188 Transcript_109989/m.200188 type:complete len:145 (-) Transcript_109989:334-768(-)
MVIRSVLFIVFVYRALAGLKTTVYEGTVDCDESDRIDVLRHVDLSYMGTIDDDSEVGEPGKKFEMKGRDGIPALHYVAGMDEIMEGLEQGVMGLCKGAKAIVVIPPEISSHSYPESVVPAGATLHFDIEVLKVTATNEPGKSEL